MSDADKSVRFYSPEMCAYDGETIQMHPFRNGKWAKREDYEKLAAERDRAVRALERNGFKDCGGKEWKPPINTALGDLNRRLFDAQDQRDEVMEKLTRVKAAVSTVVDPDEWTKQDSKATILMLKAILEGE